MSSTDLSTADVLARELNNLINNGSLRDEVCLVGRGHASLFSASRIPLREAIRQFERQVW